MKKIFINILILFLFLTIPLLNTSCKKPPEEIDKVKTLRILAWVGYDEEEFIEPLEQELGIKIEVKTYVGGDQMYTLFKSAPLGSYDLVVVDAEYGERMYKEGLLYKLERELWYESDLFSPFLNGEPVKVNDEVYGVSVRWGALGIVYNQKYVTHKEVDSYEILWSSRMKNKVVFFDWYLPNMGVLSCYLGNSKPYDLNTEELIQLEDILLKLRSQVRAIHPNTGDVINDLRTEEAWISPGIGEWAAAVLAEEGKPIEWKIPKEGGVMWVEAFAIPTSTNNVGLAKRFITTVRNPDHLARLSWRKAYHSQVPRKAAYERMTKQQRQILKADNLDNIINIIDRLSIRKLPGPQTSEINWMDVWSKFKSG